MRSWPMAQKKEGIRACVKEGTRKILPNNEYRTEPEGSNKSRRDRDITVFDMCSSKPFSNAMA